MDMTDINTKASFEQFLVEKLRELDMYEESLAFENSEWVAMRVFDSIVDGFNDLPKRVRVYAQAKLMIPDGYAFRHFLNGIYFNRKGKVVI